MPHISNIAGNGPIGSTHAVASVHIATLAYTKMLDTDMRPQNTSALQCSCWSFFVCGDKKEI